MDFSDLEEREKKSNTVEDDIRNMEVEIDTLNHIRRVNELLIKASQELLNRAIKHDASKLGYLDELSAEERKGFNNAVYKLRNVKFGTEEYNKSLEDLKPVLDLHYSRNSHHPQHYPNGIRDMDLFDVIEMFYDWLAASERTKDGSIERSIAVGVKRFEISSQIESIFRNTAKRYLFKDFRNNLL